VQVVWGAFVAGLDAGLVFNTFPLMAGALLPPMGAAAAPVLGLVQDPAGVQWMHRVLGTILLAAAVVLFFRLRRAGADRTSRRLSAVLASLVAGQYLLGVATLLWFVPIALGVLHQATAMIIAGVWVVWAHNVRNLEPDPC
jgi:cytochrome c oxidase assembly protein subunit 15